MVEEYSDEELEEILDRIYEWGIAYSKSKYFQDLTEEQKRESEFIVLTLLNICILIICYFLRNGMKAGLKNAAWIRCQERSQQMSRITGQLPLSFLRSLVFWEKRDY